MALTRPQLDSLLSQSQGIQRRQPQGGGIRGAIQGGVQGAMQGLGFTFADPVACQAAGGTWNQATKTCDLPQRTPKSPSGTTDTQE
jgi:hypothetical protein